MTLPEQPRAGVCLHLSSLPGDYGIGELGGAAFAFVDQIKAMGLKVWQFLPLGPTAYGDSPYQPLSSFAGNEMLIDVTELLRLGLVTADEAAPLRQLPLDMVNYGKLIPMKHGLLALAAGRFSKKADTSMKSAYDEFCQKHHIKWLHDYALYRVLKTRHGERAWPEWPAALAHRNPAAIRLIEREAARELEAITIAQFLFDYQCRKLKDYAAESGIALFGDVPIYIALDSADVWAHPEIVLLDENDRPPFVAGVPPDYYSEDGQLWGNPLYDWDYHDRTAYRWWVERFRHTLAYTDLVRIDHFRGFEAYWAVPYGETNARKGSWEPAPGDQLFHALRESMGELPIVAENLGVITPPVEALRNKYGMPGMVIMQFDASKEDFSLDDIDANTACYTGTHDNDTTQGWFNGGPGDVRTRDEVKQEQRIMLENTNGTPQTIHIDLIRLTFASKARLAIVPMQDFLGLGSEARLNTPGRESNNWRWRLQRDQVMPELCDFIAELVNEAGRSR